MVILSENSLSGQYETNRKLTGHPTLVEVICRANLLHWLFIQHLEHYLEKWVASFRWYFRFNPQLSPLYHEARIPPHKEVAARLVWQLNKLCIAQVSCTGAVLESGEPIIISHYSPLTWLGIHWRADYSRILKPVFQQASCNELLDYCCCLRFLALLHRAPLKRKPLPRHA